MLNAKICVVLLRGSARTNSVWAGHLMGPMFHKGNKQS